MVLVRHWSYQTVLAAESPSASRARDFVCLHLTAHGLLHLVEDIRIVASDLVTNALTHGRTPFLVTLARENESVRLTVRDEPTSDPVSAEPDLVDMSGRMMLVDMLSSEWGASTDADGVNSVWATFESRFR
jgi:hypothetical protein